MGERLHSGRLVLGLVIFVSSHILVLSGNMYSHRVLHFILFPVMYNGWLLCQSLEMDSGGLHCTPVFHCFLGFTEIYYHLMDMIVRWYEGM